MCIFAHNFEELAKRRGHSEITSFYCWLFSDLAAPRFLSCLCFGIKQTWSNYLRSRSEEKSGLFAEKQWKYMRRRWCRASVGEQKRFPVIAIKFQGFLGQALRQFLFCVSPRLGPKYHLSDWGWCISGELLMLVAAAKNSHAPLGLTEPRSWSTWSGPDEKSNTAKMPLLWCCFLRRPDLNLGQWGWIERLQYFLSSWKLLLLLLLNPPSLLPFSKERPRAVADTGSGGGSWVETEIPEIRWSWGKERKRGKMSRAPSSSEASKYPPTEFSLKYTKVGFVAS